MSSNFSSISLWLNPNNRPLKKTFCRPVNSGLNPLPSSSSAETLPLTLTSPVVGVRVPARICSSVLLPEPFLPTTPRVSPFGTSRLMSLSAQNSSTLLFPGTKISFKRSAGRVYRLKHLETFFREIAISLMECC